MKIIGRASAINLELDAGGIVNVFTTTAIAVPFDQDNVEVVDNDGNHRYLIELAEVTSYTPNGGVETPFSGTRDQLIDILNEQFFTGGTSGGSGSGFDPTTEVLQSQLARFSADTVVDAQAETFIEGERVHIAELDEEYLAKNITIQAPNTLSGGMIGVQDKIYAVTELDGAHGDGTIISFNDDPTQFRTEYIFNLAVDGVERPTGTIAYSNNALYIFFIGGGANGVGAVGKFDLVTKVFTKLADLSTTTGYDNFSSSDRYREGADPILFNGAVYESLLNGGANNMGTVVKLDLTTEQLTVVHDHNPPGFSSSFASSCATGIFNNTLYIARDKYFISIDTNDTVTIVGEYVNNAKLGGKMLLINNALYAAYHLNSQIIALKCDLNTNTTSLVFGPAPHTDTSVQVMGCTSFFEYNGEYYGTCGGNIGTIDLIVFKHDFQGGAFTDIVRIHGGTAEAPKGMLFNNDGNGVLRYLDQDNNLQKIELSTSQKSVVYNMSQVVSTVDNVTVVDINQAPLYLEVLDNHTKTVTVTEGNTLQIQTSRGATTDLYIQKPYELIENQTYTNSGTALQLFTTGDNLNIDLTSNSIILQQNTTKEFLDVANDKIVLDEGKVYRILVKISCSPTSQDNRLDLALRAKSLGFNISADTQYTNHVTPNQKLAFEFKFRVSSAVATDGLILTVKRFEGGTGLRIYNIDTNIQEIAELI